MRIIFITGNQTKIDDAQKSFSNGVTVICKKLDLIEIQSHNQKDILLHKARQAFNLEKSPILVDDTSFYIDSYKRFPGTLTRYVNSVLGLEGLSKLYKEAERAHFLTMLCYKDEVTEIVVEGTSVGRLTKKVSKIFDSNTPLNSVFIPDGFDRPISELSENTGLKNIHRVEAFKELKKALLKK